MKVLNSGIHLLPFTVAVDPPFAVTVGDIEFRAAFCFSLFSSGGYLYFMHANMFLHADVCVYVLYSIYIEPAEETN